MDVSGDQQRAWITGAGKGIGRALALRLAENGWTVAVSARTEADLRALADESASHPGRIVPYPLDISEAAAVTACVDRIDSEIGPLDLAILNAGISAQVSASDFDAEKIRRIIDVNLTGTITCLGALLPGFMKRRRGQIAIVGSLAGYCGLPTAAGYGPTKAALINMCEALKPELDPLGVQLKMVNPGFVETPLATGYGVSMPFMVSAEDAADSIIQGLKSNRFETAFPWRLVMRMRLLRMLPYWLFFKVTRRLVD